MGFNWLWPDETQFTKSNFVARAPPGDRFFFWQHCGDKMKVGRLWKICFLVVNS